MLIKIMLFLHIAGLAVWLGSLLSLIIVGVISKKQTDSSEVRGLLRKITGSFSRWIHPAAIVVIVSGIFLIANMYSGVENRPFWLNYMEMGGTMIAFLSIIVLGIVSNRMVRKPLGTSNGDVSKVKKGLSIYLVLLTIFLLLILSVIYIVAFRF
jgi:putative copper export protein